MIGLAKIVTRMVNKTCRMCGRWHMYGQPCDQQAQRELLSKSFAVDPTQVDSVEAINLVRYLMHRKNP